MIPFPDPAGGGMLGVIKPPGMSSHDVVRVARRALGTRRVGHAGTLDPLASGVLPVLAGSATRLAEFLLWLPKTYRAEILFGVSSDTGDLGGRLSPCAEAAEPTAEAVRAAVAGLVGRRVQVPPAFSARKVGGRRLYDIARAGTVTDSETALRAREVQVYSADLTYIGRVQAGQFAGCRTAGITIKCSSGTYVRELAEFAGRSLGTAACLSFLVRTACAGLELRDCLTMEELMAPANRAPRWYAAGAWRAPAEAVSFLPGAVVGPEVRERITRGGAAVPAAAMLSEQPPSPGSYSPGPVPAAVTTGAAAAKAGGLLRLLGPDGDLIALARREGDVIRPLKVLVRGKGQGYGSEQAGSTV